MTKHKIFPTPVWIIEGTPQELIDELLQGAYKCKDNIDCQKRSNQEGYQSPSFAWNEFHPKGIKYIEGVLKEHLIDKNDDNEDEEPNIRAGEPVRIDHTLHSIF